jgi:hypothetical protein
VGRFRLAMCRLLTDRPRIGFLGARTERSGTQCNGTPCNGTPCNGTPCNGTRTRWLFELQRCRSLIKAVRGSLKTNEPNCYSRSNRIESSTVRRGGLSTSARRRTNQALNRSARSTVFDLCEFSFLKSVNASRSA